MHHLLKVKLILLAFCLIAVAASQLYLKGFGAGIQAVDDDAFDAYTHFAQQMHRETHAAKAHDAHETQTVWAAVDGRGK
jgi:hypothetical protein